MASELKKYVPFFEDGGYRGRLLSIVDKYFNKNNYVALDSIASTLFMSVNFEENWNNEDYLIHTYAELRKNIEELSDDEARNVFEELDFKEAAPRKLKSVKDHTISSYAMRLKELIGKYGKRRVADEISYEIEEMLHTILEKDNNIEDQFILDTLQKMNRKIKNGIREITD